MSYILILITLLLSAAIVSYLIPKLLLISLQKRLINIPNNRTIHIAISSRLGGISFYLAIFLSVCLCLCFVGLYDKQLWHEVITISFLFEGCALFIIYLVGIADDVVGVRYKYKFCAQIISALLIITSGTWITNLHGFCGIEMIPDCVGISLTIFLFVFITNSINLIDGIDGLASLLSIVALLVYGILFIHLADDADSLIVFATIGALLPFFYYNVFKIRKRTQSKIFMGDAGSLLIGLILSIMAVKLWNVHSSVSGNSVSYYYILAYTMLIVPCFDVVRVILFRIKTHKHIFSPDNSHIHHKLIKLGLTQHQTLLTIASVSLFFLILNISLIQIVDINIIVIVDVLIWTTFNIIIKKITIKTQK